MMYYLAFIKIILSTKEKRFKETIYQLIIDKNLNGVEIQWRNIEESQVTVK